MSDENARLARYSIAVDKKYKRDDGFIADFFNIVAFGKYAEFAEKYLCQGMKILISGRVQTGTYEKEGIKIPFFEVVIEEQEFAESKNATQTKEITNSASNNLLDDSFVNFSDDFPEELPFD